MRLRAKRIRGDREGCSERVGAARAIREPQGVLRVTPAELLAFEARWPRPSGIKDETIRKQLGITPVRYYVLLQRAAESADGIRADAVTARRIRERATRRAAERERRVA
jgi:hypothetical protein